ncbi:Protein NRD1 [Pseudocercospora fuligena]|uniref:Protein NRD1 n=1 Tax=Pseudocercospora fuligena TaxID=685502 RepID=A0A8H6RQJ2_9PEZI|nr:Protein NRD1 [Pseudocercospora fuligena]
MATPGVNDLDGLLASLNQLKPPGASKNKIATITTMCVNNIQAESTIVQSFYRALKKAPATHKLGALYVIDSVVRQWIEKAKSLGQELQFEGRGESGTYPAAVKRVTELMPALFDDIMKGLPADQKPKLENMITIWERGSTFPVKLLQDFKVKLGGAPAVNGSTTTTTAPVQAPVKTSGEKFMAPIPSRPVQTPVGYPPQYLYDQGLLPGKAAPQVNGNASANHSAQIPVDPRQQHQQQFQQPQQMPQPPQSAPQPTAAAPPADVNSILAALSRAAPAAPTPSFPPQAQPAVTAPPPGQLPPNLAALFQQQQHQHHAPPPPQPPQPIAVPQQHYPYSGPPSAPPLPHPAYQAPPPAFPGYPPQPPPSIPQAYSVAPPPQQPPPAADALAPLRGILPPNILNDNQKLVPALQLLQDLQKDGITPDKWGPVLKAFEEQFQPAPPAYNAQGDYGRGRGRSRSPDRGGRGGRGSPVYGSYDAGAAKRQGEEHRDQRGGRGRYRQRSPIRNSPGPGSFGGRGMQPKYIAYDNTLPPDHIKVLSRTLFVGGANGTQQEIQELFERFGRVQTCIANRDKRHAFVKMTTRQYALAAKQGMEDLQNRNDRETMNIARQTKWGVGFGPRECCDYQRGESTIPIHKLTEADMKWLLTAEYGGTGGKQVEGGMVLEEPDIEIGAGVSSKAMSKRVGPDNNPQPKKQKEDRGGRRNKGGDRDQGYGGYSGVTGGPPAMDYGYARPEPVAVATPPAVPGFGFSLLPPGSGQTFR